MSDCDYCQNNACAKLYYEGPQEYCEDKKKAYESFENYIKWLAVAKPQDIRR